MATKLRNLQLTSVDLVRAGANQEADICLYKSLDGAPQTEGRTISKSAPDRFDTIHEVQKFNPFHDKLGRFSNKNGFSTYSANPKMRAAQPSIARSAQAGHGKTLNVHRESKGENINQNYDWMQGKPHGKPDPAPAKPTKQPKQSKPKQPDTDQKPEDTKPKVTGNNDDLAAQVKDVQISSVEKLGIVPRNESYETGPKETKVAENNYQARVAGKDISNTVDINTVKGGKDPIDKIAELQDWNKPSTVTDDLELFQKAAKQSGFMVIRTVHDNRQTGQSAEDICRATMSDGNASLGGNGMQAYGSGMYMVGANIKGVRSTKKMATEVGYAQGESFEYGNMQMMATLQPGTKLASPTQAAKLKSEFWSLSSKEQARFGNDYGAYIASKGFDGAEWHGGTGGYCTIYNKSALVFYAGAYDAS